MEEEKNRQTVCVRNPGSEPTTFILEPWAECYEMPAGAEFEVVAEGPPGGALEVRFEAARITVFAWPGAVAWLYHDGSPLGPADRPPPPATSKGMTMSDYVDRLFGKPGKSSLS